MLEKSIRVGINLPVDIIMTICFVYFQVNWVYTIQQHLMSLFAKKPINNNKLWMPVNTIKASELLAGN